MCYLLNTKLAETTLCQLNIPKLCLQQVGESLQGLHYALKPSEANYKVAEKKLLKFQLNAIFLHMLMVMSFIYWPIYYSFVKYDDTFAVLKPVISYD